MEKDMADAPTKPPTPSAPGERAQRLHAVFDSALKHTLKPCTYDNFASCFPTPAQREPAALKEFHATFVARLDGQCRVEVERLLADRDAVRALNRLDALLADAERRRAAAVSEGREPPTPPHLQPPPAILAAHLHPFLAEHTAQLGAALDETQRANASLAADVRAQRAELERLLGALEGAAADIRGAAGALGADETLQGVDEELDAYAALIVAGGAQRTGVAG